MYYSLSAGRLPNGPGVKRLRANFLWRSKDLAKWEYMHPFLENDHYGRVGDDGTCPYFCPIGDKYILHYSHTSGGKYLLGDYDKKRDKFVVTNGGDFNFGPSATPDGKGGIIAIFNMNPGKPTKGWNQIMTLPRRLRLSPEGEIDPLHIESAGNIDSLRYDYRHVDSMNLPTNEDVVLENIRGNAMEILAETDPKNAPMVEMNVLRSPGAEEVTRIMFFKNRGYRHREFGRRSAYGRKLSSVITLDSSCSSVLPDVQSRAPETAPVSIGRSETLKLRIFIDRSVVEVFVNSRQCAAVRVYSGRKDSVGVSLRSQGRDTMLKSLDAWQMKSIYG